MKLRRKNKKPYFRFLWVRIVAVVIMVNVLAGCEAEKVEPSLPNTLLKQEEVVKELQPEEIDVVETKQEVLEKIQEEKIQPEVIPDPVPTPVTEAPAPAQSNPTIATPAVDNKVPIVEEVPVVSEVFITNSGKKYHSGSCHHLSKSKISISKDEAIRKEYEPCKTCKP